MATIDRIWRSEVNSRDLIKERANYGCFREKKARLSRKEAPVVKVLRVESDPRRSKL